MFLQNKTGRIRVYTLAHEEVCKDECYCTRGTHLQTALDPRSGERGVREVSVLIPRAVHIPAYGVSEAFPEAALQTRRIKADIASDLLSVKEN